MEQNQSTPKSWRDPAKELPEVGQPCLFRYKHGIISGHFAGVDEYKQIIGRTYIWRDQTYIIYGWMPLDEANNWLAQSSAPATVEAERTTAPVSLTDEKIIQRFESHINTGPDCFDLQDGDSAYWVKQSEMVKFARALLAAAPAPIQQEPVLWIESEPSARLLPLDEIINGMCFTVLYHHKKPQTDNPVWPLYAGAALAGSQVQGDEVNEREAFEAMVKERFVTTEHSLARAHPYGYYNTVSSDTFGGRRQPDYANVQMLWDVWDARATIAKKVMREQP